MSEDPGPGRAQRWEGSSYDRISGPQLAMGRPVVERLTLSGDELVLDAGCGSGRVTELILERLPRGRLVGVDDSQSMVHAARERFAARPGGSGRVEIRQLDLLELSLAALDRTQPFDAVFSTAVFHWIHDHERLFSRIHTVLRPGGSLVAQCGGAGNIQGLRALAGEILAREPYAPHMAGWRDPWNYAGPEITEERLRAAGFAEARAWLEPSPQPLDHPREFLQTIIFGPHVRHLPPELRNGFLDELLEAAGDPVVADYVRLNIDATA